jgi:hypothetical protein
LVLVEEYVLDDFASLQREVIALIDPLPRGDVSRISVEVLLEQVARTLEDASPVEFDKSIMLMSKAELYYQHDKLINLVSAYVEAKQEEKDAVDADEKKEAVAKRKKASADLIAYMD